jgi:single-strand DNA-binding protein
MPSYNKVLLMGNLTRDPELRYLPSNMAVVNIGLAINRRWRNQQGEMQEDTTFVDCEMFGRRAEVMNQYLRKGQPVFIEGRLRLDQWEDRDGNKRSKLKVIAESFEFIDSRGEGGPRSGDSESGGGASRGRPAPRPAGAGAGSAPPADAHPPMDEDDIPF